MSWSTGFLYRLANRLQTGPAGDHLLNIKNQQVLCDGLLSTGATQFRMKLGVVNNNFACILQAADGQYKNWVVCANEQQIYTVEHQGSFPPPASTDPSMIFVPQIMPINGGIGYAATSYEGSFPLLSAPQWFLGFNEYGSPVTPTTTSGTQLGTKYYVFPMDEEAANALKKLAGPH